MILRFFESKTEMTVSEVSEVDGRGFSLDKYAPDHFRK